MTSIKGYMSALIDHKIPQEQQEATYQIVKNKIENANQQIVDLLDYSRLSNHTQTKAKQTIDVVDLVRTVIADHYGAIEEGHHQLNLELPEKR